MKIVKYFIYTSFLTLTLNCAGISTIRIFKIMHDEEYVEKVMIKLQYDYPEIRLLESDQWIFSNFDEPYRRLNHIVDTSYLSKKMKDYYHDWSSHKNFLYSADSGKIIYNLYILDADVKKCDLGIVTVSIGDKRKWFSYSDRHDPQVKDALKIFDDELLPKLKKELGEMKVGFWP
jgi:hypothetical protein